MPTPKKKKAKKKARRRVAVFESPEPEAPATRLQRLATQVTDLIEGLGMIADNDAIFEVSSRIVWKQYMAYVERGFTDEQALRLTMVNTDRLSEAMGQVAGRLLY